MDKQRIIAEIHRLANENGGKPPGANLFQNETGIKQFDWFPAHWLRWSDALIEAGYSANQFQEKIDETILFDKYIALTRELGRFPIKGELLLKRKSDKAFPNEKVFYRFGGK